MGKMSGFLDWRKLIPTDASLIGFEAVLIELHSNSSVECRLLNPASKRAEY